MWWVGEECTAIDAALRGMASGLTLLTEVINLAHTRGHSLLFVYTKPDNITPS
jgi:[citrate (pro-3S)-lyase] ligase